MNISLAGITLHVKDVERAKAFYEQIPGAKVIIYHAGQFALIQVGSGRVGLLRDDTETFHLEFDSDDLDGTHAELVKRGLQPASPPVKKPWGMDFNVQDPAGNTVEFEQKHI